MTTKKVKPPKAPKIIQTEQQLAEKQAARMLKDMGRLQNTQRTSTDQKSVREGVDIWKDGDFFFSVVFQSAHQKYKFLKEWTEKLKIDPDHIPSNDETLTIINGLVLAEKFGIKIDAEKSGDYPYPNLELKALALDVEEF